MVIIVILKQYYIPQLEYRIQCCFSIIKNNKKHLKNERGRRDIKTKKAQEQDQDVKFTNLATKFNTTSYTRQCVVLYTIFCIASATKLNCVVQGCSCRGGKFQLFFEGWYAEEGGHSPDIVHHWNSICVMQMAHTGVNYLYYMVTQQIETVHHADIQCCFSMTIMITFSYSKTSFSNFQF